jgi:hypothetical protein
MYQLLQGEVFLAERNAQGNPVEPFSSIGDAPVFELNLAVDKLTVRESMSGFRRVALSVITGQNSNITINFRDIKPENAALMLYGVVLQVATATVANDPFPAGVVNNESYFLDTKGKVSSLVITDTAGTPVTVDVADYAHDGYGLVTFLDVTGYTQPFHAAYTTAAYKRIPLLNTPAPERHLRLVGRNTAAKNPDGSFKRIELNLYRTQFDPAETLALIQDNEVASVPVNGTALEDTTKPETPTTSRYGDLLYLDE